MTHHPLRAPQQGALFGPAATPTASRRISALLARPFRPHRIPMHPPTQGAALGSGRTALWASRSGTENPGTNLGDVVTRWPKVPHRRTPRQPPAPRTFLGLPPADPRLYSFGR